MLSWRNVGPDIGGRSIAVAGSVARPHEYYFGAVGGGLWKTTDSGTTWRSVTDGQLGSASVGAVAVDPKDPDVVYIGMGEGQLRGNVLQGDGVYKSTDGGRKWQHVGLRGSRTITKIRIHPEDSSVVYASSLGDPYAPNGERGVYRSQDAGATWENVLFVSERTGVIDLTLDPRNPEVLFATAWQVSRKPWQLWSGGPESALFRSQDGGDTWKDITASPGLPEGPLGKMTVAVSPADSKRVWANIEARQGGLYRSDDGGASWQFVNGARKLWQRSFYFMQMRPDPVDVDTVYVLSFVLEKSVNGGENFFPMRTRHADIHDLWIDPTNPRRMIVGDDGGGSVSVNSGATWTEQDYPTAQMYRVVTTNDFPFHVCGTQQDNRGVCVPSRSLSGLDGFLEDAYSPHYHVSGSESGYIAPHPARPDVFFTGATNQMLRFDRSTGSLRDVFPYPLMVMGQPAGSMVERWNWTYPIVFDPNPPHALYAGSQNVWRSLDEGRTWERLSPDLTRGDPETLGETGGEVLLDQDGPEVYGTLYTLAVSPLDGELLWTGSDDGLVHASADAGLEWRNVTPSDLPVNSRVSFIEASPHQAGTAYVVAKRYEMGDRTAYAWKTSDYGRSWQRIDEGLRQPANENFLHAVRADPEVPGLLYVGAEHGVMVSFDDGGTWAPLSLNLPDTPITGLEVKGNELVAATHGRSFWILEGLATLRQLAREGAEASGPRLFAPAQAVRRVVTANVDYFLPESVKGLKLEILDDEGRLIRTLAGGGALAARSTTRAGARRASWNLRHPGATVFPGMILESQDPRVGPLAVPGEYVVRLTVGDVVQEQPLRVVADPRESDVTQADLEEQLDFALTARDAVTLANETVLEIRALRSQLEKAVEELGDRAPAELDERRSAFLGAASEVERQLYQVKNESPKDKIAYPIQLNDRLAGLLGFVALSSAAPTAAQLEILDLLLVDLEGLLKRYSEAKAEHLAALDRILRKNGRAALNVPAASLSPEDLFRRR
ncbi:MAG: glycosyl hydrolase [Acidobacteriota bacterium]